MRKCALTSLEAIFAAIARTATLYLPVEGADNFQQWTPGARWNATGNTARGPKDLFFPQTEDLMAFKTAGKRIEVIDTRREAEDFVVFGVRGCDVQSLSVLDQVFLAEPADSYYAARRAHGLIVSLACTRPTATCFCTAFGIDPTAPAGDITLWKTERDLYWQSHTEKGAALLARLTDFTEECDDKAVKEQQAATAAILQNLPLAGLSTASFGGDKADLFDYPDWERLSEACLGCGTCTFHCPTCQCYDIKDFDTGHGVVRYRCWDSCMYADFTKMAHGNPRRTQKERFRQRFMHKLVYAPANHGGQFGCVGCGRCLSACPVSMHIVTVMKTLGGERRD